MFNKQGKEKGMMKGKLINLLILGIVLGGIGIVMLFGSVHFGSSLARNEMELIGYMNGFLATGGILFAIGTFTAIVIYYKIIQID